MVQCLKRAQVQRAEAVKEASYYDEFYLIREGEVQVWPKVL